MVCNSWSASGNDASSFKEDHKYCRGGPPKGKSRPVLRTWAGKPGKALGFGVLQSNPNLRGREGEDDGSRIISGSQMAIIIEHELEFAALDPPVGP